MVFLIAIGGHVGTGKTTLAYGLKQRLRLLNDAMVIEDDQVRRELLGAPLRQALKEKDYSPEISERVTEAIEKRTLLALSKGISVINSSGVFTDSSRQAIRDLAGEAHAGFFGIWLTASARTMRTRIDKRFRERETRKTLSLEEGHASDADKAVIAKYGDLGVPRSPEWKCVDANLSKEAVLTLVAEFLEQQL